MPEGPETHRQADRLARVLAGQRTERVAFGLPRLARHGPELSGRVVEAVEARGKAVLVHFRGGRSLFSHNQLYGRWTVQKGHARPAGPRSLRVAIETATHAALLWSASDIEVLPTARLGEQSYLARLGPDALDDAVTAEAVRARMEDRRFAGRSLGALLLDQGFVAGLGNYLRSEILFVAGLAPGQRPRDLDADARTRLARAILALPRRSRRTGGITNAPGAVRDLRARGVPRRDLRFFVFGRAGRPCRACGTAVVRTERGGRRLYSCPACQSGSAGSQDASR